MNYLHQTLHSGLTVIRVPIAGVKSVTSLVLVRVGSRYEQPKVAGVSHFLEHMVFKGTDKFPTAHDVASAVDAVGAEFNAFTSKEYTGYYIKSASKDLNLALDVLSDMLLTPKLRPDDLEREKGVIVEEINMYEDTPMRHIGDVFEQMFYAGSPLGRDVIGTRETVRGMQREDFINHLHSWYGLANMVVMIVGDHEVVEKEEILTQVEGFFQKGDSSERQHPQQPSFEQNPIADDSRLKIEYKKTEQAHFILGFPGIKRSDPDRYALSVLGTVLGGNMSSRLFTEVREKRGLCYYVRSDVDSYAEAGFFGAAAGVDPSRVDEAIKVTLEQFLSLAEKKAEITEQEFQRAKDFTVGQMILGMEDNQSVAMAYGLKYLLEGEILTLDQLIQKISAVKKEEVERVAQRLINPELVRMAMIGPFQEEEKFRELLRTVSFY